MSKSCYCCIFFVLTVCSRSAFCATIVDAFDGELLRVTHEDMQQSGIAGFGFIQSAPEVLGEQRGLAMGSFSPNLLSDPLADVNVEVDRGRMTVSSNYFVEIAKVQYGAAQNQLNLDLTHAESNLVVVEFDYFDNFGDPDKPSLSLQVGASDIDGNFTQSSDPFFYAFLRREITPSDSPFELRFPVSSLTNQGPEIDLGFAGTLVFDMSPNSPDFAYAISEIRLVPEPNVAVWLLVAPLVSRCRRGKKRR